MRHLVIDLTDIAPNPEQPRKHFDEAGLRELADSIAASGLLQPIAVRPMGPAYQIIAGERRWRACRLAGLTAADCVIFDDLDDAQTFILATLENVGRRDMKPIEEAHAYAKIRALGKEVDEIAQMVGKAPFAIAWRLELLNLAPEFQGLDLPPGIGRLMSRLSIEGQRCVMRRYMAGEFKTTQECERFCNAVVARETQAGLFGESQLDGFGADGARRERARQNRSKLARAWDKATGIAQAFGPIDECSDDEIADALDGDIDRYLAEMRALESHVRRARIRLENAKALQAAAVA
jgi:ParB family chromosome partitioning protein